MNENLLRDRGERYRGSLKHAPALIPDPSDSTVAPIGILNETGSEIEFSAFLKSGNNI